MSHERRKSVVVALLILAAGVCAALPFRRSEPARDSEEKPEPSSELVWRRDSPPVDSSPFPTSAGAAVSAASTVFNAAPPAAEQTSVAESQVESEDRASPAVAPSDVPPASESSVTPETQPDPPFAANEERPALSGWRRHRIVDGDSLALLAEKYLGDPARQEEIFQANRHVLPTPNLLPIGRWLRIPPRAPE